MPKTGFSYRQKSLAPKGGFDYRKEDLVIENGFSNKNRIQSKKKGSVTKIGFSHRKEGSVTTHEMQYNRGLCRRGCSKSENTRQIKKFMFACVCTKWLF